MALVDALGNLSQFVLLPGQRHDSVGVEPLLHGISLEALIGDKAFDSDWLRAELNERVALMSMHQHLSCMKSRTASLFRLESLNASESADFNNLYRFSLLGNFYRPRGRGFLKLSCAAVFINGRRS